MAHQRIAGNPPRLVGKPLDGEPQTAKSAEAERVKQELEQFLLNLSLGSDQAQVDLQVLEDLVVAALGVETVEDIDPAGLHLFHLCGS